MQRRFPIKLSNVNIFNNNATRNLAVIAIAGYQKFISPYKGFSCAHRVLYGCESCSQYFKRIIAEEGLYVAIANAKGRFQECREANEILKSRRCKCGKHRKKQNKYSASRLSADIFAIESGNPENPEDQDTDSQEPKNTKKKKLSGSQWNRKQKEVSENNKNRNNINNRNNPCDYCDCIDCSYALDACDCLSSDSMNCPNLDCGNADCFSGMDCSGCGDCGDCGNFGSCN